MLQSVNLQSLRCVLRLSGSEVVHFLQGLISKNAEILQQPSCPPTYAALLNAKGRFMYDMIIHTQEQDNLNSNNTSAQSVLLDVEQQSKNDLIKLLSRYKLRADVNIEDLSGQKDVFAVYPESQTITNQLEQFEKIRQQISLPFDPRLSNLGLRGILDSPNARIQSLDLPEATTDNYTQWRYINGVAEGGEEMPRGDSIILEYNFDGLNGIDFDKGCYMGQELMARTHFSGVIRKRCVPFRLIHGNVNIGDEIFMDNGKTIGKVRGVNGQVGIAIVRIGNFLNQQGVSMFVGPEKCGRIEPYQPGWWPSSWTQEQVS